ncbi:hypothetical protein COBT_000184 [Conglomerata obtusa]
MSTSSDWEDAESSSEFLKEVNNKKNNKLDVLHTLLTAFQTLMDTKFTQDILHNLIDESIPHNILHAINTHLNKNDYSNDLRNIIFYKLMIFYNIQCRILCVVCNKKFEFFAVEHIYEKSAIRKRNGIVFSIDYNFDIKDLGCIYTKNKSKIITCVIDSRLKQAIKKSYINKIEFYLKKKDNIIFVNNYNRIIANLSEESINNDSFHKSDNKQLLKLPNSIESMKAHPMYIIESLIKPHQLIHPKRIVHGYFKGEPVYDRKNIQNLYTERQLYKQGKQICIKDNVKPFRIINKNDQKVSFYAKWQTEDICKFGFDKNRTMDYFHDNHKPKDCVYVNHEFASYIANTLNIDYRDVCVEIRREPIYRGIFVMCKDALILCNALEEFVAIESIKNELQFKESLLDLWFNLLKKIKKYRKIKERI